MLSFKRDFTQLYLKVLVFADLLFSSDSAANSNKIKFMQQMLDEQEPDLVILLGNAVNGSAWDGLDESYFQNTWNEVMAPLNEKSVDVAFTFGDLDSKGNLGNELNILKFINSNEYNQYTYMAPVSVDGWTFFSLPIHSVKC